MDETKEVYCVVVYTDGDKFISPRGMGRVKHIVSLPKAKFNSSDQDDRAMQATLALFNQTAIRVEPKELQSLGIFSSDENFELDVYYIKVDALPKKNTLKSNEYYSSVNDEDKRIPAIEGYRYVAFSDLENPNHLYSLKGMKNVLFQINEHFENEIPWEDIA